MLQCRSALQGCEEKRWGQMLDEDQGVQVWKGAASALAAEAGYNTGKDLHRELIPCSLSDSIVFPSFHPSVHCVIFISR